MNSIWRFLKEQVSRLRGSLTRHRFEGDLDQELDAHLTLLTERFISQGLSSQEAAYQAKKQFGGVTQVKNNLRDHARFQPFEGILQDIAYVLRQYRKSPLFASAAVLTLALGIGANTAIFTLVDQLILRLLPIEDPQRVVELVARGPFYGDNMGLNAISYAMYQTLRDNDRIFRQIACRRSAQVAVSFHSESEVLSGELVSGNYFPLLGIKPAAGRMFTANDDLHPNANAVAVLSYGYWVDRFAASRQIIGRKVLVNNYPFTVVGVSQPGFSGLEPGLPAQIFVPMMMTPALFPHVDFANMFDPRLRWINVYGRLKPGSTLDEAKAGLQPLFHSILSDEITLPGFAHATPEDRRNYLKMWLDVVPGGQGNGSLRTQYQKPLLMLMGVTGFVLLIACANLASLLAARAVVRQREIAIRLAIGSSRLRIVQQLITESLLLAVVGGVLGTILATVIVKELLAFLPSNPTGYSISSSPDLRILCFALGLSILTGIVFGLVPALQSARPDVANTLKATAGNVSAGANQINFRKILVAAQIMLTMLLLIGAGLFTRSLSNLHSVDPGFKTESLAQFYVDVGIIGYDLPRAHRFFDQLESRLQHLPGVEAAGLATNPMLADSDWESTIRVAGHEDKSGNNEAYVNRVSPGYFKTVGIRLLSGRTFRESDTETSPKVVVVSQSFATYYFGKQPAVGQLIGRGFDPTAPRDMEIVGVVNDIDYQDLKQKDGRELYLCAPQGWELNATTYLNVKGNPRNVLASARELVHQLEPKAPVMSMMTADEQLEESLITERMIASLSTAFTILAIVLAVLGLYGVMAYMVTQRAREIGIRVALGALRGSVVWLVMREVILLIAAGILLAVPLSLGLGRLVQSELYGVSTTDPASIIGAGLLLSAIAMLAGFIPARRAASSDPLQVLRYE